MTMIAFVLGGLWIFLLGATVGSFSNVCIYRIALEKSVVWPGSRCPRCLEEIAFRDNVPILGWLMLRGKCRTCSLPISIRYPLIEFLAGALFVGVFLADLVPTGSLETRDFLRLGFHLLLVSLLLIATFIDFDYYILPDSITVTGMILGLAFGTLFPECRPVPNRAETAGAGFLIGIIGLIAGGAMIWAVRIFGEIVFRREAMGFGDVTLMAMIGSFLGWQILAPVLFLASVLGLTQGLYKGIRWLVKIVSGGKSRSTDREIPFGPYLSMAAVMLMLAWPWMYQWLDSGYALLWDGARTLFTGEWT